MLIRHLWQLKADVFLHWCLMCAIPLNEECHAARGKQTYSCFGHSGNLSNLLLSSKICQNKLYLKCLNKDSEIGLAIFASFVS